jgi:signal transduction histidine kinase/DNA-binding response OmpR family regulator
MREQIADPPGVAPPSGAEGDLAEIVRLLQLELAESNREVLALTLEFDARVAERTQALQETQDELQQTNSELRHLTQALEDRVAERTADLRRVNEALRREIAERSALEEQLRHSQKLEAIGQLAGGVAHDFNNLLMVINGYSQILVGKTEGTVREQLEEILRAGERAAGLTQQLLAFSRKQVLQPRLIDLNRHVLNLQKMLQRLIGEDVALEARLADALGAVEADPGQIEQVIINLAVNARDAMPVGGHLLLETGNLTVAEAAAQQHDLRPGAYVSLAVADTGCGIPPDVLEHIFEPFFTTKTEGKGTGLGLSMVYGIIKQSGGHIGVQSLPGQGTRFTIYLPQASEGPAPGPEPATVEPPRGGSETVLVVEDEAPVRRLAAGILAERGYRVIQAASADEALRLLGDAPAGAIRLVLTDVVMPGMNGLELSQRLAVKYPALRTIFMSGYTDHSLLHSGVLSPEEPFLHKPFTPSQLAEKVRSVLDASPAKATGEPGGARAESDPRPEGGRPDGTHHIRLLILDDEPQIRQMLDDYFREAGYSVTVVSDVPTALGVLPEGVDVVLSDIQMPGGTGIDFLRQARQINPDLGIFLITGYPTVETLVNARIEGAAGYFRKPLHLEEIDARLRAFLAKRAGPAAA